MNKRQLPNPHGIHRGWRLTTSGTDMAVTVLADPLQGDHVAVVNTLDGFTLTARRDSGDFELDLTAVASKTVVIALFIEYTTTASTFAQVRAYEISPSDEFTIAAEKGELVVLGQVVVPASGPISGGGITPDHQTPAWERASSMAHRPRPLVKDPAFALVPTGADATASNGGFWENWSGDGTALRASITGPKYGDHQLSYSHPTGGVGTSITYVTRVNTFTESFDYLYYDVWLQVLEAPTSGSFELQIATGDTDFLPSAFDEVVLVDSSSGVDADFVRVQGRLKMPFRDFSLVYVGVRANVLNYATTGEKIRVGYVQFYREALKEGWESGGEINPHVTSALTLFDTFNGPIASAGSQARLAYNENDDEYLRIERADKVKTLRSNQKDLWLGGGIVLGEGISATAANSVAKPYLNMISLDGSGYTWLRREGGVDSYYEASSNSIVYVGNAVWDGAQWTRGSGNSFLTRLRVDKVEVEGHSSGGANSWTVWDHDVAGRFELPTDGNKPDYWGPYTNTLTAKNIIKAWGRATTDGVGGVSNIEGFNMTSIALSGGDLLFTFATAMDSTSEVLVLPATAQPGLGSYFPNAVVNSTTTATVRAFSDAGVQYSYAVNQAAVGIIVLGTMTN
jgi:hypothetical protein